MGSPTPQQWGADRSASQGGEVDYYLRFVSAGAANATLPAAASEGIVSAVYSATGIFTITLANAFYQVLGVVGGVKQVSFDKTHGCDVRWTSDSNTAGTVTVTVQDGDGDAVAPTSGDTVWVKITVQNYRSQSSA